MEVAAAPDERRVVERCVERPVAEEEVRGAATLLDLRVGGPMRAPKGGCRDGYVSAEQGM